MRGGAARGGRRALRSGSPGGGMRRIRVALRSRGLISTAAMVLGVALIAQAGPGGAGASPLPTRFRGSVGLAGPSGPTVLQVGPPDRRFVRQTHRALQVLPS